MGWKTINGHRYYYKNRRVGGRVETDYFGSGELASMMAEIAAADRQDRAAERWAQREAREETDAEEKAVAHWFDEIQATADAVMAAAGLHKHRGQWRRRRR